MIYVDNAATTFYKPDSVITAVSEYLRHPGNPGRGTNHCALEASRTVLDTRIKLAELFDCDMRKVVFTSGVTESLNTVIRGLFGPEDHVITTYMEHNSMLRPLYRQNCELSICDGSLAEIKKLVKENTKAVLINHVSNVTGEINPIREIGKFCRENQLLFLVDSAQSAGLLPISMKKDFIDVLCFTGHKGLLGIQGIGGICIEGNLKISPLKVGGTGYRSFDKAQPDKYPSALEAGTLNMPGIVSLNHSLDYLKKQGIETLLHHEQRIADEFCRQVETFPFVTVYRNPKKEHVGIVSLNIAGMDAAYVSDRLSCLYQIETRAGAHCAPLVHEYYGTESMVRFSFGVQNTMEEAAQCAEAIYRIGKEGRND
ncbi:MAG: aminotransferase class V-fold PLP-dependent enzyme [Fusicatenibacter sp.]|nr:aminotransferase class V-fold PLP-dependent enzyme [Lachnospiraceae bacterium]MDY2937713.1 aminotransferase class V-fold PLP-dependent enzyme [Fusicatenibacter sp.]